MFHEAPTKEGEGVFVLRLSGTEDVTYERKARKIWFSRVLPLSGGREDHFLEFSNDSRFKKGGELEGEEQEAAITMIANRLLDEESGLGEEQVKELLPRVSDFVKQHVV